MMRDAEIYTKFVDFWRENKLMIKNMITKVKMIEE